MDEAIAEAWECL
jgi:hypothetical protein